jgi:AraC-like DNA-binding protein/effector-binding domain-containing protein
MSLDRDLSLAAQARRGGWSPFHFHRLFRKHLRETPRQYSERVRLADAAGALLLTRASVLKVALAAGFRSHEVFIRAFRRCFGCPPTSYRLAVRAALPEAQRYRHVMWSRSMARCLRLYHLPTQTPPRSHPMPILSISRQERPEQPILLIERRVARSELASMLAECFGALFSHGMQSGLPIAGAPLARYFRISTGLWTVQAAMPVATPAAAAGEMRSGTLPGGAMVVALHAGAYDQLSETHAAIERWIEAEGLQAADGPWESYVTDPAQHPDPADWRTEVCWPLSPRG